MQVHDQVLRCATTNDNYRYYIAQDGPTTFVAAIYSPTDKLLNRIKRESLEALEKELMRLLDQHRRYCAWSGDA